VKEVPRRQSTGRCCPRDVVAEVEDVVEEVLEGENGDVMEPGHEIESLAAGARRSRCDTDRSILRFIFMAAPKCSAALFANRENKIASGPFEENK
jgi:hypothetical protein